MTKDDKLLKSLRAKKEGFNKEIDRQICKVRQRINTRWMRMPVNTLTQAKAAETRRLRDLNFTADKIEWYINRDLNCTVAGGPPPEATSEPKTTRWYDAISDIEWSYTDAGDRHEIDMRWMIGTTNASKYSPITAYFRKKYFKEQARIV